MNPKYNPNYICFDDHLNLQILFFNKEDRKVNPSEMVARLYKKKLVKPYGLYKFEITDLGRFALRNIRKKQRVAISEDYRNPHMVGKCGTVIRFIHAQTDSDGYDEFGYQIRFHKPICYVMVKLDDFPYAEWCFYNPKDLKGL